MPGVDIQIGFVGNFLSIPPNGATTWLVPCKLAKAIPIKFFLAACEVKSDNLPT